MSFFCWMAGRPRTYWMLILVLLVWGWNAPGTTAQAPTDRPVVADYRLIASKPFESYDEICVLEPGPDNVNTRLLAPRRQRGKAATATIEVNYSGFTPESQAAFQRAVDIWASHVRSSVPIRVNATFETFEEREENVLGSAGPSSIFLVEVDGDSSVYSNALLDAITGADQTPGDPDIVARFSSEANWYFGPPPPEGPGPAPDEADFTSVVLHELGHGLGFFGSMSVSGGEGEWDYSDEVAAQGGDPVPWVNIPAIYDRFAEDGNGRLFINTNLYGNPSTDLANALTSGDGSFSGTESDIGAAVEGGPIPAELYLPFPWEGGSSYSHLDEQTYAPNDPNSLMTPQIGGGEVVQSPGPVTCGMFADMGWPLGPDCAVYFNVAVIGFEVEESGNRTVEFSWAETPVADIQRYEIEQSYFGGPFEQVKTRQSEGAMRYLVPLENLEVGDYVFRLFYIQTNGERVLAGEVEATVPLEKPFELAAIYPNPFSSQANLELTVRRPQRFRVEVYNALGQRVAVLYDRVRPANDPRPITFDAYRLGTLPSGRYFFRVVGENFTETRSAVFVR